MSRPRPLAQFTGNDCTVGIISGILLLLAFGFAASKWDALSWLYDVKITEHTIDFELFSSWTFYRLNFNNIEKVVEGLGGVHFLTTADFRNRFFGGSLLVLKRSGIFTRKILISPANCDAFIHVLRKAGVDISSEDNFTFMVLFISSGAGPKSAPANSYHVS